MKKVICVLLCLLFTAAAFVGCAKKPGEVSEAVSDQSATTSQTEEKDPFPLEVKKWDQTIKILTHPCHDYSKYELGMYYDENGKLAFDNVEGDPVRAACLDRYNLIAEKFGLKAEVTFTDDKDGPDGPIKRIENDILTGDTVFDLVAAPICYMTKLGTEKFLYDFNEKKNDYISMDAPYWDQSAIRDLSIQNHLYYLTGDAVVSDKSNTAAMFYNKKMVADNKLEDPVKLVDNNEWTLDKMYEMGKAVAHKVSEGDKMSFDPQDKDVFGLVLDAFTSFQLMWGFDQRTIRKNEDELPEIRIDDPRNVKAWQNLAAVLLDESVVGVADFFGAWDSGVYGWCYDIFENGNALFEAFTVGYVTSKSLEESGLQYGILPMPKLDNEQENYGSAVNSYWMTFLGIPSYNKDNLDATCYFMEAMGYYGNKMVRPEYYDKTLKLKHLEDHDAERMLDLVFAHRTYDLGAIYDWGGMLYFYTSLLLNKSQDVVSSLDRNRNQFQDAIDHTIAQMQK